MRTPTALAFALALTLLCPVTATAGPYADELSKCLVESTSQRDRVKLVRWMFTAMSRHPAVESMASVSDEQLDATSKDVADLFMSLLTDSCRPEAENALRFEGSSTFETAFSVLGNVAGREIFESSEVAESLSLLEKHVDNEKLRSAIGTD